MGDPRLDNMAQLLMQQLAAIFEDSPPSAYVRIVVRPIMAWPVGPWSVWIMINWPN